MIKKFVIDEDESKSEKYMVLNLCNNPFIARYASGALTD